MSDYKLAQVKEEGRRLPDMDPAREEEIQALLVYGPCWTKREWKRLNKLLRAGRGSSFKRELKKRGFV